jgi:DNA-binding response OmpR family regulator
MPTALICSQAELERELRHTLLWRRDVERHVAARSEDARLLAGAVRPSVVLVDRDLPGAAKLIAQLRDDSATSGLSIAVLARGEFDPDEVELLEAGANAILRMPAGPDWDDRLLPLMQVPIRRNIRIPVDFAVEAVADGRGARALALNLSANGMLIESSRPLRLGDELQVAFSLPGDDGPQRGLARVVRQAAASQYGVAFLALDPGGERIERFVASVGAR